ncbi:hypothetical protein A2U01_0026705 [Trifolium medium]|uniref:Uncharacterized protein n=1 Tax=Trifolium medium TaxID=97028 RepID=A0A392P1N3_9FABA|nr:hypothetical protein [Trifolium medium]
MGILLLLPKIGQEIVDGNKSDVADAFCFGGAPDVACVGVGVFGVEAVATDVASVGVGAFDVWVADDDV